MGTWSRDLKNKNDYFYLSIVKKDLCENCNKKFINFF